MNNDSSSPTFDKQDEYPKVTQADMERATFRVGLKPAPRKQRVTILLDTGLIEYFKAKAGERGYQTLINDTLRHAQERETLEETLRRVIREELHHAAALKPHLTTQWSGRPTAAAFFHARICTCGPPLTGNVRCL